MEVIEKVISYRRPDKFKIYPIGDIHAGSIHCEEDEIKKQINIIKSERNSYIIGMGDYADSIIKNDPRFDIEGCPKWLKKDNIIESQRLWLKELFTPVKDKIICLLTGNHEEEQHNRYQDDITRNLCKDLGVPYGGYSSFIVLKFIRGQASPSGGHSHQVIIHAWHGAGAAQTEGARLMRLMRLVNDIQADIYLMGHLHTIAQYSPERLIYRSGKIKSTRLIATITGSWLTAYTQSKEDQQLNASYAERQGYKPTRIGCPVIHLWPDRQEFSVES